ncbi:MAG: hypothetical protein BroJett021_50120 [Chloroflexota bacterium]|nr:tetratricopeptide repeat protein [Caldilinea sp.]GIK76024.1 MAG: hypothetical protein BroJett021_50120 [Chloroflexota bacterium]
MPDETSISSPYLGPRPFERSNADCARFFGRDREVQEIVSLIFGHPIVLVYAQSGAGKTSIFNAGVTINLEENGFEVLPLTRVRGVTPHDTHLSINNIYTFNALQTLEPDADPNVLAQWTLADYLEQRPRAERTARRKSPRVLIFDQFEELFTSYPERQLEQQEAFFRQVVEALDRDRLLRVVFVIREDYLAQLDPFASLLPESLRIRFRLERLRAEAALLAIQSPLASTQRRFAPGVAESLVKELLRVRTVDAQGEMVEVEGQHVEPVQLQVVCLRLWSSLPPETTVIDASHVHAFGDVDEALARFYEESIAITASIAGVHEGDLRTWFEHHLITPNGMRSTVYRGTEHTGGLPNQAVDMLQNLHLIRGEWRAGAHWYELTHDRFVKPIQNSNEAWLSERREVEQARQRLESRAREWVRLGRGTGGLLDEIELREAERWLVVLDEAHIGYATEVSELVDASRAALEAEERAAEEARRRELEQMRALAEAEYRRAEAQAADARRLRWLSVVLGLVILLAAGAAWFAWERQQAAESRRIEADDARVRAEIAEATALAAEATAVAERERAEHSANEALIAQSSAEAQRERAEARLREANALRLAAAAINLIGTDSQLSLLLALQALAAAPSKGDPDADGVINELEDVLRQVVGASQARFVIDAHNGRARAVAYSSDGQRLATAGDDNTVRIWDAATGEMVHVFPHSRPVYDLALSPDGALLLTVDENGAASLWDMTSEAKVRDILPSNVAAVAFSPNGETFALSYYESTQSLLSIWNVAVGRFVKTWPAGDSKHASIVFSPNGGLLAAAAANGRAQLWDIETGQATVIQHGRNTWLNTVIFDPAGERLVTAGGDRVIKVWDLTTNKAILTLEGHTNSVNDLAFDPSGAHLASASYDGSAKIWQLDTGKELHTLSGDFDALFGVAFSPDGTTVATAGQDGKVRVWDMAPRQGVNAFVGHLGMVNDVAFSPDGNRLASAGNDNTVRLWDASTGDLLFTLEGHVAWVQSVAFAPHGKWLASGSTDGDIRIWDAQTGAHLHTLRGHTAAITSMAFSPDGEQLVAADESGAVRLWSATTGVEAMVFQGRSDTVYDVAFSPDGKHLATVSYDRTLRIWETASGAEVWSAQDDEYWFTAVAFRQDGQQIAAAARNNLVYLFDFNPANPNAAEESQKSSFTLRGHKGVVLDIEYCCVADHLFSSRIATAGDDGTVKIWDARTGKRLLTLANYPGRTLHAVTFSPQGDRLALVGHDRQVHLFALDFEDLLEQARDRLTRTFTQQECAVYFEPLNPDGCERTIALFDLLIKGRAAARRGDLQGAATVFRQAQSMDASLLFIGFDAEREAHRIAIDAHLQTGRLRANNGDLAGAAQSFQAARELALNVEVDLGDPQRRAAAAMFSEGWLLGEQRLWESAIEKIERAILLGYDDHTAHYHLGLVYQNTSLHRALAAFSRSIEIQETVQAYHQLGVTHRLLGDYTLATEFLEKAIELNPDLIWAYIDLAEVLRRTGNYRRAIELLRNDAPSSPFVMWAAGRVYHADAQQDEAFEHCNDAVDTFKTWGDDAEIRAIVAAIYQDCLFDFNQAYTIVAELVEESSNELTIVTHRLNLVETALSTGRYTEVLDRASDLLASGKKLSVGEKLIMRTIMVAASILQGETDQATHALQNILDDYKKAPSDFPVDWTFTGLRHFLSQASLEPAEERLLFTLLDLLEAPVNERETHFAIFQQQFENWRPP